MSLSPLVRRFSRLALVVLVAAGLVACDTLTYYGQAVRGQLAILWSREQINDLLADQDLPKPLREKLQTVLAVREFAREELLLPVGDAYTSYVELDREHVVWNVFAAPEFSVEPLTWCYPIAGCVSYRGYFSEVRAQRYASQLEEQGYDVYLGGVDAYSTLGWFDDPLLSTVIRRQDYQLAALIFHELAHQLVYVPGDTTFNESFATLVEQEGLRRWLSSRGDGESLKRATQETDRRRQFVALVIDYQDRFAALYASELDNHVKRRCKVQLQQEMRRAYEQLRRGWGGTGAYDSWFAGSLNNAQLSTVASYNSLVPGFEALLREVGNDLDAFYRSVDKLKDMTEVERNDRLSLQ